mmetsp:Transcript_14608/g.23774  ORF Transcript_14608/g.23774 Transcript_14608/m.23774 type:complete len:201 (-) Transcript_14608:48-650(-)
MKFASILAVSCLAASAVDVQAACPSVSSIITDLQPNLIKYATQCSALVSDMKPLLACTAMTGANLTSCLTNAEAELKKNSVQVMNDAKECFAKLCQDSEIVTVLKELETCDSTLPQMLQQANACASASGTMQGLCTKLVDAVTTQCNKDPTSALCTTQISSVATMAANSCTTGTSAPTSAGSVVAAGVFAVVFSMFSTMF